MLAVLALVSKLSEPKRNDFLKSLFSKAKYIRLRIIENIIYSLPFFFFLIYKSCFEIAVLLELLVIGASLLRFNPISSYTIPTPFSNKPFEYTEGFRKTFYVFPIAYILTLISIRVENFGLGIFSILLLGLVALSYYSRLEKKYFVWIFSMSPEQFLLAKLRTCFFCFTILSLPSILSIAVFYSSQIDTLIFFLLLCYLYLATIVFAKYSIFPNQMNVAQSVLILISFVFPPILVVLTPLFYLQSVKKLKKVLE